MGKFWAWYERHYALNVGIALGLFLLQMVHLYWLFTDVIIERLTGESWFAPPSFWRTLIIIVDYTEIPALISTSFLYINDLRKRFSWMPVLYLLMLNSQWLHLFWITDEFVVDTFQPEGFHDHGTVLPPWLAWIAILIDYLELPVIIDTLRRFLRAMRERGVKEALGVIDDE